MPLPCPLPPIEPFQRLQVNDGLLITAQLWQQAHEYHRQRQNIHYQALNQAGIVWGLGVCLIPAPMDVAEKYRGQSWLEIQPGLAIDATGNPIIVPEPIAFRLVSPLPLEGVSTVYLTLRYVDPDQLQGQGDRRFVQETFRVDETVTPPVSGAIELCRIVLQAGQDIQLTRSPDAFAPSVNQPDLRYRSQAQVRPLNLVRVAQAIASTHPPDQTVAANLSYLLQSLEGLYPAMQGTAVETVVLQESARFDYDLLHLSYAHLQALTAVEKAFLQQFLETGAIVFVELSLQNANLTELCTVRQQLQSAIASLLSNQDVRDTQRELETELVAVDANINEQLAAIAVPLIDMVSDGTSSIDTIAPIGRDHLLHTRPFLFAQLPCLAFNPIYLFNWGGIVLSIGALSSAWGIDDALSLPRETIRSAQEMGINLLHFAWKRRQLTQLQQKVAIAARSS
ncbi:MAG: hypothetical protein KME45_19415 [Stenomitos rutilans HA7619-LM2]|jgi:hypothetical protein|nr:hypothetical protein [Stenomitos rutilans HA7619-LM2]